MNVLGVWDGHDSGAALLQDGRLRVAINEERLTRRKLEIAFPSRSIAACLAVAGLSPAQINIVAVCTSDPAKTLGRLWPGSKERYYAVRRRLSRPGPLSAITRRLKYRITEWPPNALTRALSRRSLRRALAMQGLDRARLVLVDHHEAHAAGAAWASGFASCAVVTIDGVGDGLSSTVSTFAAGRLVRVRATPARSSLGVFFEHVTNLLNMRELEDEGKVMALADYASPIADDRNALAPLVRVRDGVIETARSGFALRRPIADVHWRHPNEQFAYLAQRVVERTCGDLARDAVRITGERRLALAGGVVSNVRATRQIRLLPEVDDVYVFPHMGDGGLALGAAIAAASSREAIDVDLARLDLGPSFSTDSMAAALQGAGFAADRADDRIARVADALDEGRIVMWFDGRMEYGPRALGHRSVLARPDRPDLRDRLNLVLKRRVWYQPFCPSLLASDAVRLFADWSGGRNDNMTMAFEVLPCFRSHLAGAISVNGTCRPHIVPDEADGAFARLLHEVRGRRGVGALLNTSFNIHGEPLVCSPGEAIDVFLRSGADVLAIGPFVVERPAARAADAEASRLIAHP